MKATLIHPYRHHSYNAVKAMARLNWDLEVYYGYYNKNTYFYNILQKYKNNRIISKFLGYNDVDIDKYVKTSLKSNILFLLSKLDNSKTNLFLKNFEKKTLNKVKDKDVYFFLQDYCNEVIEYAHENNKIIIYDHIMPAGKKQKELLIKEAEKYGFCNTYVDKFLSDKKILDNYKNIEKADIILNASNSTYKITEEVLGKEEAKKRSFILPYGVNFDYIDEEEFNEYIDRKYENIHERKLKILYVGSISLAKGTNYLIKTIENLNSLDVEFGIVGLPNKEEDKTIVSKLVKFNNVKYYGSVPHKQIKEIYKEYDMFVFTSIIEGFGMVTLEAMSMGLPCIVNEYCSSVVKDKYNGFIVEEVDSKYYVDTINNILNDTKLLREMSYNAYNTSKQYSWDRYIDKLTTILKSNIR